MDAFRDKTDDYAGYDAGEAEYTLEETVKAIDDAIAAAKSAGIASEPGSLALLSALNAVLPYAESEAESLYECWKRDGDLQIKDASDRCERAIENARAVIRETAAPGGKTQGGQP